MKHNVYLHGLFGALAFVVAASLGIGGWELQTATPLAPQPVTYSVQSVGSEIPEGKTDYKTNQFYISFAGVTSQEKERIINEWQQQFALSQIERPFKRLRDVHQITLGSESESFYQQAASSLSRYPNAYIERVPADPELLTEPNDPLYDDQRHLSSIDFADVSSCTPSSQVTIAIVDDGFQADHADLTANVGQQISVGGSMMECMHGTHVAGVAGAHTNNALGVAAASNNAAELMLVYASDNCGYISHAYQGLEAAADAGADIINASRGGGPYSQTHQDLIDDIAAEGVTIIAAAGNEGNDTPMYPAAYDNIIAVGGTDQDNQKTSRSNHGSRVDYGAPGVDILSTQPVDIYNSAAGTSMSSPLLAAISAVAQAHGKTLSDLETVPVAGLGNGIPQLTDLCADQPVECEEDYSSIDFSQDGQISTFDLVLLSQIINSGDPCPAGKSCDVNGDGQIDFDDVHAIRELILFIVPSLEVCGDGIDNDCDELIDEECGEQVACDDLDEDGIPNAQESENGLWNVEDLNNFLTLLEENCECRIEVATEGYETSEDIQWIIDGQAYPLSNSLGVRGDILPGCIVYGTTTQPEDPTFGAIGSCDDLDGIEVNGTFYSLSPIACGELENPGHEQSLHTQGQFIPAIDRSR